MTDLFDVPPAMPKRDAILYWAQGLGIPSSVFDEKLFRLVELVYKAGWQHALLAARTRYEGQTAKDTLERMCRVKEELERAMKNALIELLEDV